MLDHRADDEAYGDARRYRLAFGPAAGVSFGEERKTPGADPRRRIGSAGPRRALYIQVSAAYASPGLGAVKVFSELTCSSSSFLLR